MDSTQFVATLDRVISHERLSRYEFAAGGDISLALELYQHNIAISEAIFGFLHGLQVAVRNSIHHTLSRDLGIPTPYEGTVRLLCSATGEVLKLTNIYDGYGEPGKRQTATIPITGQSDC
jgi:hypothetical protein